MLNHRAQIRAADPSPKRQRGVEHRSLALPARKEWRVFAHGCLVVPEKLYGVLLFSAEIVWVGWYTLQGKDGWTVKTLQFRSGFHEAQIPAMRFV